MLNMVNVKLSSTSSKETAKIGRKIIRQSCFNFEEAIFSHTLFFFFFFFLVTVKEHILSTLRVSMWKDFDETDTPGLSSHISLPPPSPVQKR